MNFTPVILESIADHHVIDVGVAVEETCCESANNEERFRKVRNDFSQNNQHGENGEG